jgi:Plasma-membrane choline transporter
MAGGLSICDRILVEAVTSNARSIIINNNNNNNNSSSRDEKGNPFLRYTSRGDSSTDRSDESIMTTTSSTPYYAHEGGGSERSGSDKKSSSSSKSRGSSSRERRNIHSSERSSERSSGGFANALAPFHNSSTTTSNNIILPDPEKDTIGIHKPYAQHHLLQDSGSIFGQGGCRDVIFALLFYAHVGALIYCTVVYAPIMMLDMASSSSSSNNGASSSSSSSSNSGGGRRLASLLVSRLLDEQQQAEEGNGGSSSSYNTYNADDEIDIDPQALLLILCIASVLGFVLSTFGLVLMISCAELLIKLALWFNIVLLAGLAVVAIVYGGTGAIPAALLFLLMCGFAAAYAHHVWSRIPFAASNLVTAVSAVRSNMGLAFYAYWSVGVLFAWSILWFIATSSTLYVMADCSAADGDCQGNINGLLLFAFILSFYWTAQVISNVVHVTTAGTVGTWWYHPREARGCCSKAVRQSYIRALTTSFGSICLGSLIVAIVQALKEMVQRAQDQDSVLACIVVCLMGCLGTFIVCLLFAVCCLLFAAVCFS